MYRRFGLITALLALVLTGQNLNAQELSHYFDHVDIKDGLSSDRVTSITQDEKGFIWIGTNDGVNRYDGYDFSIFRSMSDGSNSLKHDRITFLSYDPKGYIWIASKNRGIDRYHLRYGTFKYFDEITYEDDAFASNEIKGISVQDEGDLVFTTGDQRRYKFDYDREHFVLNDQSLNNNQIVTKELLTRLRWKYGQKVKIDQSLLLKDNQWLLSLKSIGLVLVSGNLSTIQQLYNRDVNKSVITSLFQDGSGIVWIGTDKRGIYKFNPSSVQFRLYNHFPEVGIRDGRESLIRSALIDHERNYWIASQNRQLIKINPVNGRLKNYKQNLEDSTSIASKLIKSLYQDSDNNIWVGGFDGISKYDKENDTFLNIRLVNKSEPYGRYRVEEIVEDKNGNLWLANFNNVVKLNKYTLSFESYDKDLFGIQNIKEVYIDSRNRLWLGGQYGDIVRVDLASFTGLQTDSLSIKSFSGLSSQDIYAVEEDTLGNIWVGTINGLNRINPETAEVAVYSIENGLPTNLIFDLTLDNSGNLWMITTNGVSSLNIETGTFQNFNIKNGLQDNNFSEGAIFNDKRRGEMIVGGVYGFNTFYPDRITTNQFSPNVIISGLKIQNKNIVPGLEVNDREVIQYKMEYMDELTLKWRDRIVGFEFVGLHYVSPKNNQYAYLLEGYHSDWVYVGSGQRYVSFMNLPPGDYTLMVKASNSDGVWNEEGARMTIILEPEWWQMTWFRLLLIVVLIASVYFIIYYRRLQLKKRQEFLQQKLDEAVEEIRVKNESLKRRNEIQRQKIDEAYSVLEEIQDKSDDMGVRSENINGVASSGVKYTETGIAKVRNVHEQANAISNYSSKAEDAMDVLKRRSNEISRIIKLISEIAARTNLLSLNAAMEAAQAGHKGEGFANVAEEIKTLATESRKFVKDVDKLIKEIQEDTQVAAELIEKVSDNAQLGVNASEESTKVFEEISDTSQGALNYSRKILETTREQSDFIKIVVNTIGEIVEVEEELAIAQ